MALGAEGTGTDERTEGADLMALGADVADEADESAAKSLDSMALGAEGTDERAEGADLMALGADVADETATGLDLMALGAAPEAFFIACSAK